MNLMLFSLNFVDQRTVKSSIKASLCAFKISVSVDINIPCSSLKFFPQLKEKLACATLNGTINIILIYPSDVIDSRDIEINSRSSYTTRLLYTFDQNYVYDSSMYKYPVSELSISPDGCWLAVGINQLEK